MLDLEILGNKMSIKRIIAIFLVTFWYCWGALGQFPAYALPATTTYQGATVIDVNQVKFKDFPALQTSGRFSVQQIAEQAGVSAASIIDYLGYDPSRSWSPGTKLTQIYKLGDFGNTLQNWSLKTIADNAGQPVLNQTLNNFGYLGNENIKDLSVDIPKLQDIKIKNSRVLTDLILPSIGTPTITYTKFNPVYSLDSQYKASNSGTPGYSSLFQGTKYIGDIPDQVLENPKAFLDNAAYAKYFVPDKMADYLSTFDSALQQSNAVQKILNSPLKDILSGKSSFNFGDDRLSGRLDYVIDTNTELKTLDLSQYNVTDLPNFENAEFAGFEHWKESFLEDIQNLPLVPVLKFVGGLTAVLGAVGKIDIAFGDKEANRTNTVTGSYQDGFKVPCKQDNCAHLELTNAFDNPLQNLKGKQWISGNSQQVNGGSGFLKFVNGGKEPTGRHPFGDLFKVLLTTVDESTGSANFGVNFRICLNLWFASGCTPYFIGPLPWFSQKEKDIIFLGLDGVEAPIPLSFPPLPRPSFEPYRKDLPTAGQMIDTNGVMSAADDPCATYHGVNLWAFREAMAKKESSGNYYAVGTYVPDGGNGNKGRALGRYQFMTYREDVAALYKSQGAGKYIEGAKDSNYSVETLRSSISKHFPPEIQEKFWRDWSKQVIDRAFGNGNQGAELVKRAASFHLTGLGGKYNFQYGEVVWSYYQGFLATAQQNCQAKVVSTGGEVPVEVEAGDCSKNFIRPAAGPVTSGYGYRTHPITGVKRLHAGLDVGIPQGTSVVASASGVVQFAGNKGGYGNTIDILHCNGRLTRYAHLMDGGILVQRGQKVSQGSLIGRSGSTGLSTGPHLHFEVHINGQTFDPKSFVKF